MTGFGMWVPLMHYIEDYDADMRAVRTEIGALGRMGSDPALIPRDKWQYFSLAQPVDFIRVYQEGLPGIFELVVVVRLLSCAL